MKIWTETHVHIIYYYYYSFNIYFWFVLSTPIIMSTFKL